MNQQHLKLFAINEASLLQIEKYIKKGFFIHQIINLQPVLNKILILYSGIDLNADKTFSDFQI